MKILSPHRRKKLASRRFGGREFQNKIKKAQGYKREFDPRNRGMLMKVMHWLKLDNLYVQVIFILVIIIGGYFLFVSEYFLVNEISVSGSERVSSDAVKESLQKDMSGRTVFIPNNHFVFLTRSGAQQALIHDYPLVKEISKFKKVWPNKIEVEIVERTPGFAFYVGDKNFLVDEEGVVVRELSDTIGLIQVIDQVSEPLEVGERLNNTKLVAFTISAIKAWPGKIKTGIKEARVPGKASSQVQFVSQEGWAVFFDVGRPAEKQLSNLSLIISRQIPAQRRLDLAYIDLRFEKWAYYCYKDLPCQAHEQPEANVESTETGPVLQSQPIEPN